jgi:hypothetical protein
VKNSAPFCFLLLFVAACSSPPPEHNYPMGPLTFTLRGTSLHGSIPAGWFAPVTDSLTPALAAWLVNDDYSASISLREISLDATARRRITNEGMPLLVMLSMAFRGETGTEGHAPERSAFTMNGNQYGSYETAAAGIRSHIIVFSRGGKYYECEARQHRAGLTETDMVQLRRVQAAVLFSLAE